MWRAATAAKAAVRWKPHAIMLIAWSTAGPPHMHAPTSNVDPASGGGGPAGCQRSAQTLRGAATAAATDSRWLCRYNAK